MADILVLNGPNLNLLGTREPEIYGNDTLDDINQRLQRQAKTAGLSLDSFQSNDESALLDQIHAAPANKTRFILINAAALTHTSVALRDALCGVNIPFIEVHISNVFTREEFRHHSFLSDVAVGVITGMGVQGYELALDVAIRKLTEKKS
jgi:3-dehydroquinate dehydratase-2